MGKITNKYTSYQHVAWKKRFAGFIMLLMFLVYAETSAQENADESKLIDSFIQSKGYNSVITFDASNVKRFWIDNSVASKNNSISLLLKKQDSIQDWKSDSLKVKLKNVNESQDCNVVVLSKNSDIHFSVADSKSKSLSSSHAEDDFIQYHVESATFHLDDTPDYSFNLIFSSKNSDAISLERVFITFSNNKEYDKIPPRHLSITDNSVKTPSSTIITPTDNGFMMTGKQSRLYGKEEIDMLDRGLRTTVKIKNTGKAETRVYIGFNVFLKDHTQLTSQNYPYKNINKILSVVSAESGSNEIIVDSFSEWNKNCLLAINAKEDLSDIPNLTFVNGIITDQEELPNGQSKITISAPLTTNLEKGSKLRIHGSSKNSIYCDIKVLKPNEEYVYSAKITKIPDSYRFLSSEIPKEAFYLQPILLSYSIDPELENSIEVMDYFISY